MFEEVTIGECRLILGDCREVLPLLHRHDAVVCSPPYNTLNPSASPSGLHAERKRRSVFDERHRRSCQIAGAGSAAEGVAELKFNDRLMSR